MRSILLAVALLMNTPVPASFSQTNATANRKGSTVYLCSGSRSKVYHRNSDCTGLTNCSTSLKETTPAAAKRLGRRACKLASCEKARAASMPAQPPLMEYAIGSTLALLLGFLGYRQHAATSKRKEITTQFRVWLMEIEPAARAFNTYTSFEAGYFNNHKLTTWKTKHRELYAAVNGIPYQHTDLAATEKATVRDFLDHYNNGEVHRQAYNAQFTPREIEKYNHLLSNVGNKSLDEQQRAAIVNDEDNALVVAGAGSGKTTTIIGKVQYVMERYRTNPSNILLISFTNKSAADLTGRINIPGIQPRTFHKFGKDVIRDADGKQPSLYDESQFGSFVSAAFKQLMLEPAYAEKVTTYFVHHLKPAKPAAEFHNQGEYIQHLKEHNFRSYKCVERTVKGKTTYKQEVVKSVEECHIANFLLFNGVDYQYEYPYEHATASSEYAQWKPDFTLRQGEKIVYLEHFGVDREGNVPAFFAKPGQSLAAAKAVYGHKMEWARETSRQHGTVLLESYSYEMQEHCLFNNLKTHLKQHGITLQPKAPAQIWTIISEAAADEVSSFQLLLQTFITLMKSNNDTVEAVRQRNAAGTNERQKQRHALFLDLVAPLYARYQQELATRKEIDFSDLINLAVGHIRSGDYTQRFDYIIVDEFQDISRSRAELIRALQARNPACKLFCVGDDWQSVYRFAGSDLSLFKDFRNSFGYHLESKIEKTYRFHEPLISESSQFIMRNPDQVKKALKSGGANKQTHCRIVSNSSEEQDDTAALQQVLNELLAKEPDLAQKKMVVLGRYSHDLKRINTQDGPFRIVTSADSTKSIRYAYQDGQGQARTLEMDFLTVHKSKGLEGDIVIVLNCNAGKFGFPSEMSDDPVLALLLSESDRFENGEERRLFYVALTRAKEQVILIADPASKSKFILELEGKSESLKLKKCPACVTADMLKRSGVTNGKSWAFYGCTNYTYGCDYREWIRDNSGSQLVGEGM